MKPKQKCKMLADVAMTLLLPVLMAYQLTGQLAHDLLTLSSPFIGNLNMSFPPFLFEKNSNDMTAGIEFKTIRVSVIQ